MCIVWALFNINTIYGAYCMFHLAVVVTVMSSDLYHVIMTISSCSWHISNMACDDV